MALLTWDHGIVALGGTELPGALQDLDVRGQVRFDEGEQDGVSGKAKVPLGWEDCVVTLTMLLPTDDSGTCYAKLKTIDALFRGYDSGANPKILDVANEHLRARSVSRVVFSGLSSRESNRDDAILATLGFEEYNPPVVPVERRIVKSGATGSSSVSAAPGVTAAEDEPTLVIDMEDALVPGGGS